MIILLLFCSKLYLVIFVNWWLFLGGTSFLNFTPEPNGYQVQVVPCKIQYLIILHYFLNLEVHQENARCYPFLGIDFQLNFAGLKKIPHPMDDPLWSILLKAIWWWCDDAKEYCIVQHESWDMANTWVLTTAWIWKNYVNLIMIFNKLFANIYRYTRYMCRNDRHWSCISQPRQPIRLQLNQFHYH